MIINHNMRAINANRQMGVNQANAQNSMEKLSSGLRINKAGDDAAGLTISEKMRGQIRGLDQANRNAQDGISLIQTAEGGLSETHSILQRMRELSVQSSNDTNTDADRLEIQKEIEELTKEIDRIGNTTEFNTKNLLQGNTEKSSVGATVTAGDKPVDAITGKAATWDSGTLTALINGQTGTLKFNGVTVNINAADGLTTGATDVTKDSVTLNIKTGAGGTTTADDQLAQIANALKEVQKISGSPLEGFTIGIEAGTGGTADANDKLIITGAAAAGAKNNEQSITFSGNVALTGTGKTAGVDEVKGINQSFDIDFSSVPTEGSSIKIGDKVVAFYDSSKETFDNTADAKDKLDAEYVIDTKGKTTEEIAAELGKLDFTTADGKGATLSVVGDKVTVTAQQAGTAGKDFKVELSDAYGGKKSELNIDISGAGGNLTTLDTTKVDMKIQVGDKSFEVDLKSLKANLNAIGTYGHEDQTTLLNALKEAKSADGTKLSDVVDISINADGKLSLVSKEVGTSNIEINVSGETAGGVNADELRTALGLSATGSDKGTAGKDAVEKIDKDVEISFQVGANEGQNLSVKISDMRAEALAIDTMDVSKKEGAEKAITTIDKAIATVSSQRSNLGAVQNRLEHTINNLGTTSENLTAAESRIRDVDMAKEMMEMSKHNILQQASQAMLAQANQAPQQVLQLLR